MKRRSESQARSDLRARLEGRREEIEQAALTRVRAIADSTEASDPLYAQGLHAAVTAAIDYAFEAIESGDHGSLPIPVGLLAQARLAARNDIPLGTVLRRYFAGYSLLGFFLIEEASRDGLMGGAELQRLTATQAARFDRLLAAVGEEHARESEVHLRSSKQHQAERIVRLLEGELIDTADIAYDFEGWHLGLAGDGIAAERSIRKAAAALDCRFLALPRDGDLVYGWLGSRHGFDLEKLVSTVVLHLGEDGLARSCMALGEPGEGLAGWRLSHRQAAAALSVAKRGAESVVRYIDVLLLTAPLRDDLLAASLRRLYLEPLANGRDGGDALRATLRAYLAADGNLTSAAAALGVNRSTVTYRLQVIEGRIGRSLSSCGAELRVALDLDELAATSDAKRLPRSAESPGSDSAH